jgi:hypothetical protein
MKLENRITPGITRRSPQSRFEKGTAARSRVKPLATVPVCGEAMITGWKAGYRFSRISEAA